MHPNVKKALDEIPPELRSPFHGHCVEPQCLSKALEAGVDPKGGTSQVLKVRSPEMLGAKRFSANSRLFP
jgi:hypothetical protein